MIQPHSPAQQQHPPTVAPNVLHFNPATRQLNAASIFQKLGLSDPQPLPEGGHNAGQAREDAHLADADFDGLGDKHVLDDVTTPRPGTGSGATSYLDAVSSASIASRLGTTGTGTASRNGDGGSQRSTVHAGAAPQPSISDRMVMAIDADVLLPYADRPSEVMDLLERVPKNRGLFDLLRDIFTPKDSSNSSSSSGATSPGGTERWAFSDVQKHLTTPREQLCDQDWIDILKAHVYPRSSILWERLRACLGVDVDDERGGDRYEELSSDIVMHPSPRLDAQPGSSPTTPGTTSAYSGGGVPHSLASHLMSPRTVLSTQMGGMNLQPPPTSASNLSISPGTPNSAVFSDSSASSLASPRQPFHTIGGVLSSAPSGTRSPAREQASAALSGGSGTAMPRNHRRTSSGSSGFRRSLTMSSISENAPVDDFTHNPADEDERADDERAFYETTLSPPAPSSSNSTPAMTPSNSSQGLAGRVGLGDLLRLRGYPVDSIPSSGGSSDAAGVGLAYSSSSSSTGTTPAVSPQSAKIGLYGSTNAQAPGHLPPPSPMSPALGSSPASASGGGMHAGTAGGAPSALGLSLGSASSGRGGATIGGVGSVGRPSSGFASHRDARRTSYDEYAAVFESSDGESMSGRSVGKSLGRGPGVSACVSARDDPHLVDPSLTPLHLISDALLLFRSSRRRAHFSPEAKDVRLCARWPEFEQGQQRTARRDGRARRQPSQHAHLMGLHAL